ncbi:VWA domain-containing protein [Methylocystis echinoides]|uniref:VWA domain-containing protein n=1 Tax=Methylocystis echinoides TaxID=29468 RepID=A0A9W6LT43_9HYPH|nr:VWA domain-containing protein [Methylocystis echinoides]GLI94116.1 VWA domain-containing protein [Methylocystis echinoides]
MTGVEFAAPLFFALLPAPLLLLALAKPAPQSGGALTLPASIRDRLHAQSARVSRADMAWPLIAASIAWVSLVLALAGPRVADAVAALPASGRDIMFVLDLSGSMTKQDFRLNGALVSRLDLVKHVGSELIRRREGDRIGLVVFAETALVASPLSFDIRAVARALDEMEIGLVGRSTAIGEGLGLALKRLAESASPSRVVILLSDGANTAGSVDPVSVAALAKSLGVRVYTIGLGVDDTTTNPNKYDAVDFDALQNVARIGGGSAFRARTGDDLDAAARAIEALAAGDAPAPSTVIFHELWIYPATVAFAACAAIALTSRMRR